MEKICVLLVDDDAEACFLLREDLEQTGQYEVFEMHKGKLALDMARRCRPDIVLLDIMIPDLDGPSIAAQLEAANLRPKPIIVFLSSILSHEEAGQGTIGGYRFLSKDTSREDTLRFVGELSDLMAA